MKQRILSDGKPARVAIKHGDTSWSYAQTMQQCTRDCDLPEAVHARRNEQTRPTDTSRATAGLQPVARHPANLCTRAIGNVQYL